MGKDDDTIIASGIKEICELIHEFRKDVDIIASGVIPGKGRDVKRVKKINFELGNMLRGKTGRNLRTYYKIPDMKKWTIKGGTKVIPNPALFKRCIHNAGYKLMS